MTTATGQYAINFGAPLSDQNPWSDGAWTKRSGGTARIASGLLRPNTTAFYAYTGGAYDGSAITASLEANASATDDEPVITIMDSSGYGYGLLIQTTQVVVLEITAWVVTDSAGTGSTTLTANDLYAFTLTKGSPNSYSATKNGSPITLSQSTATHSAGALGTLEGGLEAKAENVGTCAIKSFAIVSGLGASVRKRRLLTMGAGH